GGYSWRGESFYRTSMMPQRGDGPVLRPRVETRLDEVGGAHQRARLVERLLPLAVGRRVVDDAAAGLRIEDAALDDSGAQRDRGVHVVLEREVADRAGVNAAAGGLELVDDLHRAHLGRAGHGARRERGAQHV